MSRYALIPLVILMAACAGKKPEMASTPNAKPIVSQSSAAASAAVVSPTEATPEIEVAAPVQVAPAPVMLADKEMYRSEAKRMKMPPPPKGTLAMMKIAPLMAQPSVANCQNCDVNTERYQKVEDNPVKRVAETPVSTFSIDVDTGSYSNVRRLLQQGQLPNRDAVRVEELVNYFPYDYAQPKGTEPFAVHTELAPSPWNPKTVLMRIGIKGKDVAKESLPAANLVFLVDTSGSMSDTNKLPLVKTSLKLLLKQMRPQDRITLVTYAGSTAVVLPPTSGREKATINAAIERLDSNGSTNGESGIQLAYQMAQQGFIKDGINRILLATDGDFNVGITDFNALKSLVEEKRKSGVTLSTLGYGGGNYNDQLMEQLADAGNGAYSYVDSLMEGHKVLVNEMTSTLATIAKDVKIQIEFNPKTVQEYRLIGYENRALQREDFNNDKVDAGDIGAGHTVTAIYELTLAGEKGLIDPLRYQNSTATSGTDKELALLKLRYKAPNGDTSQLMSQVINNTQIKTLTQATSEFRFASAVAGFGQLLRGGKYTQKWDFAAARQLAAANLGTDAFGYRGEFLRLIDLASALETRPAKQQAED